MNIKQYLTNLPGWHTNRKIVVIESDDWGSIRMPSKKVYDYLLKKGYHVNDSPYERYDSLGNHTDLESLFDVLSSVRDRNNHPAILTANSVVANPDFDKIKKSGYQEYHYELFFDTFKRYNNHSGAFDLWQEGLNKGIFIPQFHGREHFNIPVWMRALRKNDKDVQVAFDLGMAGIAPKENPENGNEYLIAYLFETPEDIIFHQLAISEGLDLFEQIWGYKSESFIAPCYTWSKKNEYILNIQKIKLIQGMNYQFEPRSDGGKDKIFHYSGEKNHTRQRYNVRNCFFEPSLNPNFDWVDACLNQVKIAFRCKKPAVICSHRVNFIGNIDAQNRDKNLIDFKNLLVSILKKWPDVEFISSDKLIDALKRN